MSLTRVTRPCSSAAAPRHPAAATGRTAAALPTLLAVCALLLAGRPASARAQMRPGARTAPAAQTSPAAQPARVKDPITVFFVGAGGFGGGTGNGAGSAEMAALSVELARPSIPWVLGLEGQHDWTLARADSASGGGTVSSTSEAVHVWIHHDWRSESSWTPFFGVGAGVGGLNSSDGSQKAHGSFGLDGGTSYQPGPVGLRVGTRAQFSQHGALVFITLGLRVRLGPALGGMAPGR